MADPHHLLLITTDQQRFDTIHAAGNPHIRTPHLNWLLNSGIHYTRCYTDSPVSCAARATIMTGRHGWTNKYTGNGPDSPMDPRTTLAARLTQHGYQTRVSGKMHFRPNRCHFGFEHMEILEDYYRYMARHPHLGVPTDHGMGQNEMEPCISTVDEPHSLTHWTVDRSVNFLETRDHTRPYFLWTSFSKPHPPWDPCANYWALYDQADLPPPVYGDWSKNVEDIPQGFLHPTRNLNSVDLFDERLLKDCKRAYYACITQIDYNLGLLFARMREMDLLDRTTIIFTADHGEMLGDHRMGAKSVHLEGSGHVPMIVRPAASLRGQFPAGARCDELVCLADIMPTFLNLAGASPAEGYALDGHDLLASARGEHQRTEILGQCGPYHAVIEKRYKYLWTQHGGGELLFDLENDPCEQHELIRGGEAKAEHGRLRNRLIKHLTDTGNAAAKDGNLVPGPLKSAAEVRAASWPGFHSRDEPQEVLH